MLVNFKDVIIDAYGNVELPTLILKHRDGRIISSIGHYNNLNFTLRFNDVSEVTFDVSAEHDGIRNHYFDKIRGHRLINIEPFGDFILMKPERHNDGVKEIKKCRALSLEYGLNFKELYLPRGTYNFYNPADNKDTILDIILEKIPDWSIGNVDPSLIGRWRTFDNVNSNLYSFMLETLQEIYGCLFLFDIKEKKINVISSETTLSNIPVYLSYENLIKNGIETELSDEIVTSLSGYGSGDNMSIAYVNPNGTDKIYNLDYLVSSGELNESLTAKWIDYQSIVDYYQKIFSNIELSRLEAISTHQMAKAKYAAINRELTALETSLIQDKGNFSIPNWQEHIKHIEAEISKIRTALTNQDQIVKEAENNVKALQQQSNAIVNRCKINNAFTPEELKQLSVYMVESSITEPHFVVPQYNHAGSSDINSLLKKDNNAYVKINGSVTWASNIAKAIHTESDIGGSLYKDEINTHILDTNTLGVVDISKGISDTIAKRLNADLYRTTMRLQGGIFEFGQTVDNKEQTIKGSIVDAYFHFNNKNINEIPDYEELKRLGKLYYSEYNEELGQKGYFILTLTLRNATINNIFYPVSNIILSGRIKDDLPNIDNDFIYFYIDNGTLYHTATTTEFQKYQVYQELYNYTKDTLKKLSEPSYQFSIESANILFADTFKPFKEKLALGHTVNLNMSSDGERDCILHPILIEVSFSYHDWTSFNMVFSDKYRKSNPEFRLADLLENSVRATKSLEINKASYSAYINSKADNAIDNLVNSSYDVAKNAIINSNNQGIEWNEKGLFLRKKDGVDGTHYLPEQIGMINNMIAMTDDNWKTVKLAVGKFKDSNVGDVTGIVAPNIQGTLFAGKNLVIENTVQGENEEIIKQFKVDDTGASLYNSSLMFNSDKNGGKILLDPKYGLALGNNKLFSGEATDIKPSFINDDGHIEYDDVTQNKIPINTSLYFDINTGNAYFKGDIYADNGYFGGTINAKNIIAGTLNGRVIEKNSIDAGTALRGAIQPRAMVSGVVEAINSSEGNFTNCTILPTPNRVGSDELVFGKDIYKQCLTGLMLHWYHEDVPQNLYTQYIPRYNPLLKDVLHSISLVSPTGTHTSKSVSLTKNGIRGIDNNLIGEAGKFLLKGYTLI